MTAIPKAAIEAAVKAMRGCGSPEPSSPFPTEEAMVEAAILAALPHLGEPAEWQRYVESMGWWQFVASEDMAHYHAKGAVLRPLYLAPPPPAPAPAIKPVEWGDWTVDASVLAGRVLSHLGYGTSPSLEPGSDERRDRVAAIIYEGMPAAAPEPPARIVRHKKRGSTYEVIGPAEGQISFSYDQFGVRTPADRRMVFEGDKLTIYRAAEDGKLWWRFPDEFEDGRYEDIQPAAPATASAVDPVKEQLAEVREPVVDPTVDVPAAGLKQMAEEMLRDTNAAVLAAATRARVHAQMAEALKASDRCNHDMLHVLVSMISAIRAASPKLADRFQVEADKMFEAWPRTETAAALAAYEKEARRG